MEVCSEASSTSEASARVTTDPSDTTFRPPQLDLNMVGNSLVKSLEPETEPEEPQEMPGTPPFEAKMLRTWTEADRLNAKRAMAKAKAREKAAEEARARAIRRGSIEILRMQWRERGLTEDDIDDRLSPEEHEKRHIAARKVQRALRAMIARRRLARHLSAAGRPVHLQITQAMNLEMLCDFRDVVSMYCNVRVLKKPFGPFMFQFSTSKAKNVNRPEWNDVFFVPLLSSKCDIVVTFIGVTSSHRQRFLGQAIAQLGSGWEHKPKITAPLGKWKFPVEENLLGLHRFVQGTVELQITPVSSRLPCKAGQFLMAPPMLTRASSFSFWSRKSSPGAMPSPMTPKDPSSASPGRANVVTRWGVLTDTFFHLFDNNSAKLLLSFDLAKIQLIQSFYDKKGAPNRLFPVKIYAHGRVYALYVSTYAQQQAWEYKINLHRRKLLIP